MHVLTLNSLIWYHEERVYFINLTEIAHVDGERNAAFYDVTANGAADLRKRWTLYGCVDPDRVEEYRKAWESLPVAFSDTLARYHFGNLSVALRGCEAFIYYEYCGAQYEKDLEGLRADAAIRAVKSVMEALMTVREDGSVYEALPQIFYSK